MAEAIKVFVSYSWDVERKTGIVDELEKHCQSRNVRLLRDNNEIKHGELIQQFMDKLTGGEHVITVFSKSYFQSPWCMYELLKTWQKGDFQPRTHPIIADDCNLQDVAYRISVVDYWVAEHDKIRELLKGRDPALFVDEFKKANMLRDISQNANELMNFAAGRLTTSLDQLKAKHYVQLLDPISPLYEIPPAAIFQPAQSDQVFMLEINARLQEELDKSNTLRKAIAAQVEAKGSDENSDKLASILIDRCEDSLDELLRDDVYGAMDATLQELSGRPDNDSPLVIKEVQQLTSSADTLFSCLVLYAVREQWMADYHKGCSLAASNLRQMPFGAAAAVEIVTSRHLQRVPRFKLNTHKSEIMGEEGVAALEQGFDKDDIVTGILRQIWVKVFPMDSPENLNEKRLGAQIKTRHKRKGVKKNNYYLVVPDDENHPLTDTAVRDELMRRLPELPLIILKTANCGDALLIPDDEELVSIIFDFYLMLDEYIPYEPDTNRR